MRRLLLGLALTAAVSPALAGEVIPTLVRDINPLRDDPFAVTQLTAAAGTLFFVGDDARSGRELWRSDGTGAGTVQVADLHPGPVGSVLYGLTAVGSRLFFVAEEETSGRELWTSDGTAAGTRRVADIHPGSGSSDPAELTAWSGRLFFVAEDGTSGRELWTSDGTAAGTRRVADIVPGPAGSDPSGLTRGEGRLFFTTGLYASELWVSDGTAAGTVRLAPDLSVNQSTMRYVGGTLFFCADGRRGLELWTSDGSVAGTRRVVAFDGFPVPVLVAGVRGQVLLVFVFEGADDEPGRLDIWTSDGTVRGTKPMGEAFPGTGGLPPRHLTSVGGGIFFTTRDASDVERLWTTDASPAGAQPVTVLPGGAHVELARAAGGVLAFTTFDGLAHILWTSDGTAAGTAALGPVVVDPEDVDPLPTAAGGLVFFVGHQRRSGYGLWASDGTTAGTREVASISARTASSFPSALTRVGQTLFFGADDGTVGRELWRSDGTPEGTVLVGDLAPGPEGSNPRGLTDVDGRLLFFTSPFTSSGSATGAFLWTSDGTASGTIPIARVPEVPELTHAVGGTLYFVISPPGSARVDLWRSDGTAGGTRAVTQLPPGAFGFGLADLRGALILSLGGAGLWRSDGTAAGTARIADVPTLAVARFADAIFFTGLAPGLGWVLWRSDGTRAGTAELAFVWATGLTPVADTLFFFVPPPAGGTQVELWRSDGSTPGTVRLRAGLPLVLEQVDLDGTLLFTAAGRFDPERFVSELWTSDGSSAGTERLVELDSPASTGSPFLELAAVGRTAFFRFDDGVGGQELWALRRSCGGGMGPPGEPCDDGDACTADTCRGDLCLHEALPGLDGATCRVRELLRLPACAGETIPRPVRLAATLGRVEALLQRATLATRPARIRRLFAKVDRCLRLLSHRIARLARKGRLGAHCSEALARGIDERRVVVAALRPPSS